MHIAITGNIGAGKTTLAELLAAYYDWEVLYEAVDGNPYLADFYDDMPRWAFQLQVFFLNSRFAQIRRISQSRDEDQAGSGQPHAFIQDRTIYEDSAIFARNLHQNGQMTERDYQTYLGLFHNMLSLVRPPDLTIYLRADLPKLRDQIRKRGRSFEQSIGDDYLLQLNSLYEEFIRTYQAGPLLVLDVNMLDYANRPTDFNLIIQRIDEQLTRLAN